jgi:hypothetical protein
MDWPGGTFVEHPQPFVLPPEAGGSRAQVLLMGSLVPQA